MKRHFALLAITVAITLMACSVMDAQAQSTPTFVSQVEVTDEVVTFKTDEGNYVDFIMKVAGPDGFWLEKTFTGKDMPSLRITTEKGFTLPDGSYIIEMSARPRLSQEHHAALDEIRQKGDHYAMGKLMDEIGLNPEAMVYTAHLG